MAGTGRAELLVVAGGTTRAGAEGVEQVIAGIRTPEPRMLRAPYNAPCRVWTRPSQWCTTT